MRTEEDTLNEVDVHYRIQNSLNLASAAFFLNAPLN